ncbi:hypothetical protein LWX53_08350, partial [bacterium]|nr:hypothetical protein [bacterium]
MKRERMDDGLPLLGALKFPGMLYASTIRSSVPRARRAEIQRPELPPGYRCIAPADLLAENLCLALPDGVPLFADGSVAYKGEALGLIVGPDAAICDELARNASAVYEEEDPE